MIQSGAEDYRPSDDADTPAPPGKKNTRRWCKGKTGREHDPIMEIDPTLAFITGPCTGASSFPGCKHRLVCYSCGKVLGHGWQDNVKTLCPDATAN